MARRPVIQIPHPHASPSLRRALGAVRREFAAAGLAPLLEWVRVEQVGMPPTADAMGWYYFDRHTIRVPAWTPRAMRACARTTGTKHISLRAVLRHEFGHALFDYLDLERDRGFRRRFGRGECVSAYAATNAEEDFAETFMRWMTWGGDLRRPSAGRGLRGKWRFVGRCVQRVRAVDGQRSRSAA
jgi:hypothetical protein